MNREEHLKRLFATKPGTPERRRLAREYALDVLGPHSQRLNDEDHVDYLWILAKYSYRTKK